MIVLHIDGEAVPALRARVTRFGTYTPERYANWKALVAYQIQAQKPPTLEGPLNVAMTFWLVKPKSRRKADTEPDKRPDLDNLVKGIMDTINASGMVWQDDAQVCALSAVKRWSDKAGVEIWVDGMQSWPAKAGEGG